MKYPCFTEGLRGRQQRGMIPCKTLTDEPYLYAIQSSINIVTPATVDMSSVET